MNRYINLSKILKFEEDFFMYMKNVYKGGVFALFFLAAISFIQAQEIVIPPAYVFYKGDTLKGFDWKAALDGASQEHAIKSEIRTYLYRAEKKYVEDKYHIAPVVTPQVAEHSPDVYNSAQAANCNNADFEDGNYTNWTGSIGENDNSSASLIVTSAGVNTLGVNSGVSSCSWHTLVTTGTDPYGGFPMLDPLPGGGTYSCRLGGDYANVATQPWATPPYNFTCGTMAEDPNSGSMGEILQQSYPVSATNSMFTYDYAVMLDAAPHSPGQEPYFRVQVIDSKGNDITCLDYYEEAVNGAAPPGYKLSAQTDPFDGTAVYYLPWTTNSLDLRAYIGTTVTIVFSAAGCTLGGHFGYAYIDCSCGMEQLTITKTCTNGTITAPPGAATYSWSGPGVVSGGSTQTATVNVSGTYTVTLTTATGCTYTFDTAISIPPPIVADTTSTNVLCYGDSTGSITVTGVTGGVAPYTYAWSNGNTTTSLSGLPAGTYSLTVTDSSGCTGTTVVTIKQPAQLKLTAKAFPVSCNGECNGQATVIPSGGTTPYSYLWSDGTTTAGLTNLCPGSYSVTVKDNNGCIVDTNPLTVTEPPPLTMTTADDSAHCNNADGSATVTTGGGTPGYTYMWSTGATTSNISNVISGTYCVKVTDANKCVDSTCVNVPNIPGDTATIIGSTNVTCNGGNDGTATGQGSGGTPPYTYSWSTTPVQTTPTATGLTAGTYTLTVTDAVGCPDPVTVTITQPPLVVATPPAPQTICINGSASLTVSATGGTPGYTYTWAPSATLSASTGATVTASPTVTTTYTINTTDSKGCIGAPVTVTITVNPPLSIVVTPQVAICPGGFVRIGATGSGGDGVYTYTWAPATGLSCTVCQNPVATPTATTVYTVTLTDACGTPAVTDSVKVIVNPVPVVNFQADTLSGCTPLCVNFTDATTIASGGLQSWAWTFGDGSVSDSENPSHCYTNAGVFTVSLTVKSDSGCVASFTRPGYITTYSHPVAAFTAAPQPATILQPTITFTDKSTDAYGIASWAWLFGDPADGSSNVQNPVYTYTDTGTFCPQLIVTNVHGCTDTVTHCLVIEPFFTLYIPNAFSQNGDGVNDVFTAKGTYVCSFEMWIFDRWGMKL